MKQGQQAHRARQRTERQEARRQRAHSAGRGEAPHGMGRTMQASQEGHKGGVGPSRGAGPVGAQGAAKREAGPSKPTTDPGTALCGAPESCG